MFDFIYSIYRIINAKYAFYISTGVWYLTQLKEKFHSFSIFRARLWCRFGTLKIFQMDLFYLTIITQIGSSHKGHTGDWLIMIRVPIKLIEL